MLERRSLTLVFIAGVVMHLSLSLAAVAAAPQERVRGTLEAVAAVMHDPLLQGSDNAAERKQRVRHIILDTFDFEEMAPGTLGAHWDRLTAQQRTAFVSLFGDLFERSYNRLVLRFLGDRETAYGTVSSEQDRAIVRTTLVVRKTEERLPVDYRLIEKGQRWAVFDVVVDGISLAQNYRAQFDKILRSSSYETLVQKIRRKLAQEPA